MSNWGGAVERLNNQKVEEELADKYGLDMQQTTVIGSILHTMTYHRTYTTAEVKKMLEILLEV